MVSDIFKWLTFGATQDQLKFLASSMWRLAIVVHIAWVCNWLAIMGVSGVVRADELSKKVDSVVVPLQQQIAQQTLVLSALTKQIGDQLSASVASEIRAQTAKRCTAKTSVERERVNGEIDKLQEQYYAHKNKYYITPSCDQL